MERIAPRLAGLLMVALLIPAGAGTARAAGCLTSTADLRTVLAMPGAEKSGRSFCLNPGRYTDLRPQDFTGAFVGIDPARPVTFEAADPANPPVLNRWLMASSAPDQENGDVILRHIAFDLGDEPKVPVDQNGFRGVRAAVSLGVGGPTRNVTLDTISVRGPLSEASRDPRETAKTLVGVDGDRLRNVVIRDSRFEQITNAIIVAGTGIEIIGNRMRHSWGDLIRVSPQVLDGGKDCAETSDVVIRDNMLQDSWSNNRQHPDVVQMFAAYGVSCDVSRVLIEGNLAYPGVVGMRQPSRPPGMRATAPMAAPAQLAAVPGKLYRLYGPGQSILPPANCQPGQTGGQTGGDAKGESKAKKASRRLFFGVQLDGLDGKTAGPVTLIPAPGTSLQLGKQRLDRLTLTAPWETWRLACVSGGWKLTRSMPSLQGIFTNALPGRAGYHDITIRHNILWVLDPMAVGFRDGNNSDITVERNSFLAPWPGDLNGDGQANTYADGFNEAFGRGLIVVKGGQGHRISANVASFRLLNGDNTNDAEIRFNDGGVRLSQRFNTGPGPRLLPDSPAEALALARPRGDGVLAGRAVGAVATNPADDPYDWGWVAEPW